MIGRILCRLGLHAWRRHKHESHNLYFECAACRERTVVKPREGYQPIDQDWLGRA